MVGLPVDVRCDMCLIATATLGTYVHSSSSSEVASSVFFMSSLLC